MTEWFFPVRLSEAILMNFGSLLAIKLPSALFDDSPRTSKAHVLTAPAVCRELPLIETIGRIGKHDSQVR